MSFCNEVKEELSRIKTHKCCQRAEGMGMALAVKKAGERLALRSSLAEVSYLARYLLDKQLGCQGDTKVSASGQWYTVTYPEEAIARLGFPDRRIDLSRLEKPCCRVAFLRGAFLSCGHLTDPHKHYRLDFLLPDETTGAVFSDILRAEGFLPRRTLRKDGSVCVYFFDSTSVEDLLTYMGATLASLTLMEVKVEKNYANALNRRGNFDTANYVKTFEKAESQVLAIRELQQSEDWDALPESTRTVACLRLEHTDASLSELARLSHLGRSTVDRRLRDLMALAQARKERG